MRGFGHKGCLSILSTVLVLMSCKSEQPPPLPEVDLVSYRARFVDGDKTTFQFDRGKMPIVRLKGTKDPKWRVRLKIGSRKIEPELKRDKREEWLLLRTTTSTVHLGEGEVQLLYGSRLMKRWPARFAVTVSELPELKPAIAARKAKRFDEAVKRIELQLKAKDRWVRVQAMTERGRIEFIRGDYKEAAKHYRAAAEYATSAGIPSEVAKRWLSYSFVTRSEGEYEAAERAASLAEACVIEPATSYYQGLLAKDLADHRRAERKLQRAVHDAWLIGADRERDLYATQLAAHLENMGRTQEALDVLDSMRVGNKRDRLRAGHLSNIGWVELNAMASGDIPWDTDRLRQRFEEALDIWIEIGAPRRIAVTSTNLAHVHIAKKDFKQALSVLDRSDRLWSPDLWSSIVRSEALMRLGRTREATQILQRIIDESSQSPHEVVWRAHHLLGTIEEGAGHRNRALHHFEKGLFELERLARRTQVQTSRHAFHDKRRSLREDLIAALLAANQLERAFLVSDNAKALVLRNFDRQVSVSRLSLPDRQRWFELVQSFSEARKVADRERRRCWRVPKKALTSCQRSAEQKRVVVSEKIEVALAFLEAKTRNQRPPDWLEQCKAVLKDEAIVSVSAFRKQWLAFVLTNDGIEHFVGENPLPWVLKRVKGLQGIFVAPGRNLAFADLALAEVDGSPLAAHMPVRILPYVSLLASKQEKTETRMLVVADPNGNLPKSRKEAQAVANRYGEVPLVGSAATRGEVLSRLTQSTVLHFAGHAVLRRGRSWKTRLLLSGEEALTMEDFLIARSPLRLAVLHGCSTGVRPEVGRVESGIGLPEVLMASGTSAILATERTVEDGEAISFIKRFYDAQPEIDPARAYHIAVRGSEQDGDPSWQIFRFWGT